MGGLRNPVGRQHLVEPKIDREAVLQQGQYTRDQTPGRTGQRGPPPPAREQNQCQPVQHESDGRVGDHGIEGWPGTR